MTRRNGGSRSATSKPARGPAGRDPPVPRDNGIGIRDKHKNAVFRMFKRLNAPEKFGGGSGVGLTIVQKIVQRHGGRIWIESELGVGTTFFFTLEAGGAGQR